MKRQFTVITKDGSKWLRPTDVLSDVFNVIYLGSAESGTVLSEDQLQEVKQWRNKNSSSLTWWSVSDGDDAFWTGVNAADYLETRTAYTDAEPPDIDYEKEMPHKKWPSTKYVARKMGSTPFNTQNVRPLVNQLIGEEISFSRFVELLNEIANGN